jgi:hypothetical protein
VFLDRPQRLVLWPGSSSPPALGATTATRPLTPSPGVNAKRRDSLTALKKAKIIIEQCKKHANRASTADPIRHSVTDPRGRRLNQDDLINFNNLPQCGKLKILPHQLGYIIDYRADEPPWT